MYASKVLACLAMAAAGASSPAPSDAPHGSSDKFTYDSSKFLVDGEELIMLGGQMDPQRIPREYWDHRLKMAKAMGLNTVFSYHYWNEHEPVEGEWDFEGQNDIAAWYQAIADNGLYGVLRPGSYICGERDWGGLPSWLSELDNLEVRKNNKQFLDYSEKYLSNVAKELEPLLVNNGGPILMVQVENEYGSFDNNHDYTNALADIFKAHFDAVLYTNDGPTKEMLEGGHIPGILAEYDGVPKDGFENRDKYVPESSRGPLLNGEYYIKWFDSWSTTDEHQTYDGDAAGIAEKVEEIRWMVDRGGSFNIYMWHGATNWGFGNGAINATKYQAFTTSYDYGSPLDESGRPSQVYGELRKALADYNDDIPEVPEIPSPMAIEDFELTPFGSVFDNLPEAKSSELPITFEGLGQNYGFVLYEHEAAKDHSGVITPGDMPRDRVIVYVNGARQGVIDRAYVHPGSVEVEVKAGDKLSLFVENLGRVDYGEAMTDPIKGIKGDVKVGGETLTGWDIYGLPFDEAPTDFASSDVSVESNDGTPVVYKGSFKTEKEGMAADTFLELPDGVKGVAWVNGFNLGRYWAIGPQQQLYLPGCLLKQDEPNEVVILELEPKAGDRVARGLSERTWANNDDPDCGNCSD